MSYNHEQAVNQFLKKNKVRKTKKKWVRKKNTTATGGNFYKTKQWKTLRYKALLKYGNKCCCCGATPADGETLNVDHIQPIKKYPKLKLSIDNLQILCSSCNWGKGSWDETDWRTHMSEIAAK